jgi:FtsH-binding integral membrane protein
MAIAFLIQRIARRRLGLFFVYALTMGLTLGVIVYAYVGLIGMSGVVSAFAGAAAIFGGAAVYGYATKRDLTSLGGLLFMGLLGLVVVMFLQIFFFADSTWSSASWACCSSPASRPGTCSASRPASCRASTRTRPR